jgi:hypothetical protein
MDCAGPAGVTEPFWYHDRGGMAGGGWTDDAEDADGAP